MKLARMLNRVPPDHAIRGRREDLDEMLGNLRDLVELYRGSITLESAPHGGVRARLELPAAETVPSSRET